MHFADLVAVFLAVVTPAVFVGYFLNRWFNLKQRKLEIDAGMAAEKAAQYAVSNKDLEQRVRVLEQIVTDGGATTAAQIDALRQLDALPSKEKMI